MSVPHGFDPHFDNIVEVRPKDERSDVSQGVDARDGALDVKRPKRKINKFKAVIWDTWDKPPRERKVINKIDWWIMTYVCLAYFVKYL